MSAAPDHDGDARLGSVPAAIRAALARVAVFAFRHAALAIVLVALAAALGTWSAGRLKLDPDITQLLPPSYPSVQGIEALRARFGGVGYVVLLVEGGDRAARRRFADEIAPRLEKLETVQYVDHRFPAEFFEDRGLYFADPADLTALRDRLAARQRWEIERSYLDLDDEPPPSVDVADLEAKYRKRLEDSGGARRGPYHEDETGSTLAILVRPTRLASDLTFAKQVVADVERVLREAEPTAYAPDLRVELTGRYPKRVDLQAVLGRDLALTSALALGLVVAYLAFHFRRLLAIGLVLAPLYAGLALAYGAAGALFGTLNILTAFIGAILVGIGMDHGVHLLGRYEEERRAGAAEEEAIRRAFGEAGRVSLAAALTTAAAFCCLTWTDFRAFREFGLLAALGTLLVLLAYLTLLPALLGVLARHAPRLSPVRAGVSLPGVRFMHRAAPALFGGLLVACALALTQLPHARFDADFSHLDDADLPSFRRDREVNALLGRSQTPLVVLARSEAEAREVSAAVRARMTALGEGATIGLIATRADLLPEDQEAKRPLLREIAKITSRIRPESLDEDARGRLERLRRMAAAEPFGPADLPPALRHTFEPKPGADPVHFVLLYPTVSMADAAAIKRLAAQLRRVDLPGGEVRAAAGEPMVLADMLETIERDAPRILVTTGVLVFLVLYLTLGRLRLALLALGPALLCLAVTIALLPVFGAELNYLNMIVLPILLGIGVDDGAHLLARVDAGESLEKVWQHTGWDVTGAILTDGFGFGVLALATHPGLASVGKLSLLGLGVNLVACVVLLPALLALLPAWKALPRVANAAERPSEPSAAPPSQAGS
ncbi:MMPL family transporter [Polyangium sp. 15x6]|uniref:efflux RND transporter permease subunit n=1 Tax=Polyangium sp. 15x6 TaxID=3042687 RepID=UPI00249ACA61|nr:MMPL family transporter [Polyangium sp. 15x6]MDI3287818.1 MMPL family transporter [Polyangium sp. 15x6]